MLIRHPWRNGADGNAREDTMPVKEIFNRLLATWTNAIITRYDVLIT
jgi:hypothetical protein